METTKDTVCQMMIAKANLDAIPLDSVDADYIAIQTAISKYIKKYCKHNIVQDCIDLHPDKSATIFYCEYCYELFTESK